MSFIKIVLRFLPRGFFWEISKDSNIYLILNVIAGELDLIKQRLTQKVDSFLLKNNDDLFYYREQYQKNFQTKEEFINFIQLQNRLTKEKFEGVLGKGALNYVDHQVINCNSNCDDSIGYVRGNWLVEVVEDFTQAEYNNVRQVIKDIKHIYMAIIIKVDGVRVYL